MASRRIEDLHPITREKAQKLIEEARKQGIELLIYCTYRSPEEQLVLHMQGRLKEYGITVQQLNEKRKQIGLASISEKEASTVVTNAKPWQSFHQYGLAFDCVPVDAGKPNWNNTAAYQQVAKIADKLGLEWAGNWKTFKELPHFQDTDTYNRIISKK